MACQDAGISNFDFVNNEAIPRTFGTSLPTRSGPNSREGAKTVNATGRQEGPARRTQGWDQTGADARASDPNDNCLQGLAKESNTCACRGPEDFQTGTRERTGSPNTWLSHCGFAGLLVNVAVHQPPNDPLWARW